MTMTETRPEAAAPPPEAPAPAVRDSIFSTGDHKRLGRVQLVAGLLFLLAGAVALAMARAGASDLLDLDRLATARAASAETTLLFVLGLPMAWSGIATIVVPLQIGATRLALPRLHAVGVWGAFAGAAVIVAGYIAGTRSTADLASWNPLAAGRTQSEGTELWLMGHALFTISVVLLAISLLVTILTRRTEGMTIPRMPALSASILVTAAVTLLAAPVFLAGLALAQMDQHFGGELLSGQGVGSRKLWQHLLFLPGRPEILLLILPALGATTDIVATHARRALLVPIAGAAFTLFGVLSLLTWAEGVDRLRSITQPITTLPLLAIGAPVGICVLLWLGTLKQGKPKGHVSLLAIPGILLGLGVPLLVAFISVVVDVEGAARSAAYARSNLLHVSFEPVALVLVCAIWHWAPKISGRQAPAGLGALAFLAVFAGGALATVPGWAYGLGASEDVLKVAPLGGLLLAGGAVLMVLGTIGGTRAADDPYEGSTLEWATTSPPPPHNFDSLPEVRSAAPLADLRQTGASA